MKQHTILKEGTLSGVALHSGRKSTVTVKPSAPNTGIVFKRIDLAGTPKVVPSSDNIGETLRSTSIVCGDTRVRTAEHLLAAIYAMGINNILIELSDEEPPILDGSAKNFVNMLLQCEVVEQDAEISPFKLKDPITISNGNRSIIALPYDGLKISATFIDDNGNYTQHLSLDINKDTFAGEIAPARTFVNYDDIKSLIDIGCSMGGTLDSAVIIRGDQAISSEPLRYKDEFVRHKILDIIGDISLLGVPLNAHIIAIRPGHSMNAELIKAIYNQKKFIESGKKAAPKSPSGPIISDFTFDTTKILNLLPHRYPFVMVDRVIEFNDEDELRAIKNVTINEPYFVGHFPGQPVMPGVLQIEAMAQAAGILMLKKCGVSGQIAYFMSCDKVKFRRAVTPGDQLEICVKITKHRGQKIGIASGKCKVNGDVVSSAELMFMLVGNKE